MTSAYRQLVIARANVNPDFCRHIASLGHDVEFCQTRVQHFSLTAYMKWGNEASSRAVISVATILLPGHVIKSLQFMQWSNTRT